MRKLTKTTLNMIPILLMIALIPFVKNDYYLLAVFAAIICASFIIHREKKEWQVFVFGLIVMTFFEYIFVGTGVETFSRNSLLGIMPIWLPVLWAYGFVAIKRAVTIIGINA